MIERTMLIWLVRALEIMVHKVIMFERKALGQQ